MKYDSLIFDLDGTLWDSRESIHLAWSEILQTYPQVTRIPTTDDLRSTMGLQTQAIIEKLFAGLGEEGRTILQQCIDNENRCIRRYGGTLYPGVPAVLARLSKRYPLAIVSNCQPGYIEAFFEYHGLGGVFRDFQCEGCEGRTKGENIRLVTARNGFESPLYIGDTLSAQQAALEAGIDFVWARYGFGQGLSAALAVDSFEELSQLLER